MPAKRSDAVKAIDAHVGARLRTLRELRGLSQGELARRLGFRSRQAVAAYEAGDAISAAVMFRLTAILEIEPRAFFDGLAQADPPAAAPPLDATPQAAQIARLLSNTPEAHHGAILNVVRAMAASLGARESEPD